jgi:hypothetical protein
VDFEPRFPGQPLKLEPMAISAIKVLETVKEGRTVFAAMP